jgi:hypothetical protein
MTIRAPEPGKINENKAEADAAQLGRPSSQHVSQNGTVAAGHAGRSGYIVGGIALVAVIVLVVLATRAMGGMATVEAPTVLPSPQATSTPVKEIIVVTAAPAPTAPITPTPACVSGQSQLALIEAMEHKSDWKQAVAAAEAALDLPTLCDADRRALTQKAVADGLNVLYYTAVDGQDRAGQQHAVDTYLALKQRAHDARVDFPSPLQVATQAFQISQFRLAITAVETAYTEQDFDPRVQRDVSHLYVSALYSIGLYYTKAPQGSDLYTEGLTYLSASHRLAVQYQTGQGEAAILLTQLAGPDETTWPQPYASPLLTR